MSPNPEDPHEIPDPLRSSVDAITRQQRPVRPRPVKVRTVTQGAILADRPRKKGGRPQKSQNKVAAPYVDPDLLDRLARAGRWVRHVSVIRYAIWHCVRATPQTQWIDDLTLWDRLGRWASETRTIKSSAEFSERHMALGHLQRLIVGIRGIEANPVRSGLLNNDEARQLKEVVFAWKVALERLLQDHPEHLLTPDEAAGMVPLSQALPSEHQGLLDKPAVARRSRSSAP